MAVSLIIGMAAIFLIAQDALALPVARSYSRVDEFFGAGKPVFHRKSKRIHGPSRIYSKGGKEAVEIEASGNGRTGTEQALFGLGCFWRPQEEFAKLPGVKSATTGYARAYASAFETESQLQEGGPKPPSYFSVCRGDGRTESVLVEYDPAVVSYGNLLRTFWENHDASERYPDSKEDQYRSVIWALSEDQRDAALQDVKLASEAYEKEGMAKPRTFVADIASGDVGGIFTPAESIHQNFWPKLQLKLVSVAIASLLGSSDLPFANILAAKLVTGLLLLWWGWEVLEMMGSAAASVGLDNPLALTSPDRQQ